MVQCPECGNYDTMGLGFCITCGKVQPKSTMDAPKSNPSPAIGGKGITIDADRQENGAITSLSLVVLAAAFILLYLLMNDTDPMLILMVEAFPVLWFFLILIQWRSIKGKSGNS